MQWLAGVLGTIVLLACIGAAGFIACVGFVLFGPVPVNRKITIVSRIQPEPMPMAALPIQLEAPIAVPAAPPAPPVTTLPIAPEHVVLRPDGTPFPPRQSRLQHDAPIIQPAVRRSRGDTPAPRQRMARGTEGPARPRATFDSIAVTTPSASAFETEERTFIDESQLS